jgi:hypothetical protein
MQNYHSSDVGFEVSSNSHSKPLIMICNHSSSNWSEPPIHKAWWVVLKNSHNEPKRHNCKNDSERQNDERNIMSAPCFMSHITNSNSWFWVKLRQRIWRKIYCHVAFEISWDSDADLQRVVKSGTSWGINYPVSRIQIYASYTDYKTQVCKCPKPGIWDLFGVWVEVHSPMRSE